MPASFSPDDYGEAAVSAVGENLARAPHRCAGTSSLTTLAIETAIFSEVIPVASSLFRLYQSQASRRSVARRDSAA
jgi:hypothetical protein